MAISAPRDNNRKPVMIATLNTDGVTPALVYVNPVNNAIMAIDSITGTSYPSVNAQKDANRISTVWGVSSADGITPIPIYCDSSGNLLIKST